MPSKLLPLRKNETGTIAMVDCAEGEVSVYRRCAYCVHCLAVRVGEESISNPYGRISMDISHGRLDDQGILSAAVRFNVLIRDGDAIICGDVGGGGYQPRTLF